MAIDCCFFIFRKLSIETFNAEYVTAPRDFRCLFNDVIKTNGALNQVISLVDGCFSDDFGFCTNFDVIAVIEVFDNVRHGGKNRDQFAQNRTSPDNLIDAVECYFHWYVSVSMILLYTVSIAVLFRT